MSWIPCAMKTVRIIKYFMGCVYIVLHALFTSVQFGAFVELGLLRFVLVSFLVSVSFTWSLAWHNMSDGLMWINHWILCEFSFSFCLFGLSATIISSRGNKCIEFQMAHPNWYIHIYTSSYFYCALHMICAIFGFPYATNLCRFCLTLPAEMRIGEHWCSCGGGPTEKKEEKRK